MFAQTAKLRFERSRLCLLCPIGCCCFVFIFIFIARKLQTLQKPVLLSMAKWSLLQGLKWHGGGLIIPQPHAACGCDMAINSGPRFNSVTKDRSVAPATFERGVWRGFCNRQRGEAEMFSSNLSTNVIERAKVTIYAHLRDTSNDCWLNDRFGEYEMVVILIPLRLGLYTTQEAKNMYRNMILFENCQLIHWSSNIPFSWALFLMKNHGNNWGIRIDRSRRKKVSLH